MGHEVAEEGGRILRGLGREIHAVSDEEFLQAMKSLPKHMPTRLAFMSPEHHAIRDFAAREMPRQSESISALAIAQIHALDLEKVNAILSNLEEHLFFLVRDERGNVNWAFPVTTDPTPHHLTFSTGEKTFGAWAEDAFATSFVQGRLRGEKLRVRIDSKCHHCSRPLLLEVDEELKWQVLSGGRSPLLFEPDIRWSAFRGENIIHDY